MSQWGVKEKVKVEEYVPSYINSQLDQVACWRDIVRTFSAFSPGGELAIEILAMHRKILQDLIMCHHYSLQKRKELDEQYGN